MRRRTRSLLTVPVLTLGALGALAACDTNDGREMREPTQEQRDNMPTTAAPETSTTTSGVPSTSTLLPGVPGAGGASGSVSGTAGAAAFAITAPWTEGGPIDVQYTCRGAGTQPVFAWTAPPAGTVELALLVTDPDADGYVHYAVSGIEPVAGQIGPGALPPGAIEGTNTAGTTGWTAPCPPAGAPHTYNATLYALAQQIELPAPFAGTELEALVLDTAFTSASISGTFAG